MAPTWKNKMWVSVRVIKRRRQGKLTSISTIFVPSGSMEIVFRFEYGAPPAGSPTIPTSTSATLSALWELTETWYCELARKTFDPEIV